MKCKFSLLIAALAVSVSASAQVVLRVNTVAGNGAMSFTGDGGTATNAALGGPLAIDFDSLGNYYILDHRNYRVRKVNTATVITSVAGNGSGGNTGDGSVATTASVYARGLAVERGGDFYISDESFAVIRKVNHITGIITKYAGTYGVHGYTGNGGQANNATFRLPYGMTVDDAGNLYVADAAAHSVRKITKAGIISTVAGTDTSGYTGDFGFARLARLDSPYAVALDKKGNLYIADHGNNVIRKVDTFGIITTVAGTYNTYGRSGDGGSAILATLNAPKGMAFDTLGNMYIADGDNHCIRKVDTFGIITTVAGTITQGFGGDLGPALSAQFDNPHDVAIDKQGSLYIADANNQRIRKVYNPALSVSTVATSNVVVFPNPASDMVTVTGLAMGDIVNLYDVAGRLQGTWTMSNDDARPFLIRSMPAGTYFLQALDNTGSQKASIKFVKK